MKKLTVAILIIFIGLVSVGAASSGRLLFKAASFSIQPLEVTPPKINYQTLMMFLPSSDGFAPNVNVQIQPFKGTINDYAALSKKQFAAAKIEIIKETKQGKAVFWEYSGELQGRQLHWYAKAISNGPTVYLATATASAAQWATVAAQLKSCVDSFAIN